MTAESEGTDMLKLYGELAEAETVKAHRESVDWDEVLSYYGNMREDVVKVNFPDNIVDGVTPRAIEENWNEIRRIIRSIPSYGECLEAMTKLAQSRDLIAVYHLRMSEIPTAANGTVIQGIDDGNLLLHGGGEAHACLLRMEFRHIFDGNSGVVLFCPFYNGGI